MGWIFHLQLALTVLGAVAFWIVVMLIVRTAWLRHRGRRQPPVRPGHRFPRERHP